MPTSSASRTRGTSSARALFLLFAGLARTIDAVDCLQSVEISDLVTYLAARACTTIDGGLTVDPNYAATDLISLPQLASVSRGIFVESTKIVCLDLRALLYVNGSLSIQDNKDLLFINVTKLYSIGRILICVTTPSSHPWSSPL